jgi:hypothetical protein
MGLIAGGADLGARLPEVFLPSLLPGGPEALWRDLGGGMETHRASDDVKAGTGLKHEDHL